MPANLISPCSGLSDTQSNVPYGTREPNPLATTVADSMSRAMARDCDRRRMVTAWSPSSQFRLSTLATVPVRITRLSSNPVSPVTSLTNAAGDFRRQWHIASVNAVQRHVRFLGNSGRRETNPYLVSTIGCQLRKDPIVHLS